MKRTLTLFMASLFAAGAMAQTEEAMCFSSGNPDWGQAYVEKSSKAEDVTIYFRAKWSAYTVVGKSNSILPADYKGIKIAYEYAEGSDVAVQFDINGKLYSQIPMDATEVTLEFNDDVKALETIDALNLQQSGDGKADFTVKSATLIKADDTEEKMTAFDGTHNTALMAGNLIFSKKWDGSIIKDAAGVDARFDITAGETHTYVVEFAEALPLDLTLLVDKKDDTAQYGYTTLSYSLVAPAGSNKMEITLKPDMFTENIDRIQLWVGVESTYPATVQIVSVKRIIAPYDNSPISNIKIDEVEDGQLYNLMGQPVDKSYKGIKISKSGKKFL
jgi:hypothetical protein